MQGNQRIADGQKKRACWLTAFVWLAAFGRGGVLPSEMLSRWEKGIAFTLLLETPRIAGGPSVSPGPKGACLQQGGRCKGAGNCCSALPVSPLFIGLLDISADPETALPKFWGGGAGLF